MVSSARKSRELSIQQIFLLLAILNGIVVISVWYLGLAAVASACGQ